MSPTGNPHRSDHTEVMGIRLKVNKLYFVIIKCCDNCDLCVAFVTFVLVIVTCAGACDCDLCLCLCL